MNPGALEAFCSFGPEHDVVSCGDPKRPFAVHEQLPGGVGRIIPISIVLLPARAFQTSKSADDSSPNGSGSITSEASDGAHRKAVQVGVVAHTSVLDEAGASPGKTHPESSIRNGQQ